MITRQRHGCRKPLSLSKEYRDVQVEDFESPSLWFEEMVNPLRAWPAITSVHSLRFWARGRPLGKKIKQAAIEAIW